MIGRVKEREELTRWMHSGRPEFIVVYGRRRVGKTYLVEQHFRGRFAFFATGVASESRKLQLRAFHDKLVEYGSPNGSRPRDWFEAFARLKELLSGPAGPGGRPAEPSVPRDPETGRLVVFLDEMPWMDTPRSDFKVALEHFWNGWASKRNDIVLIACGSATSWLTKNLLQNTGGLYGRVTGKVNVRPFNLGECEELLRFNGVLYTRQQVIETYLVFGGIPYYLNLIREGLSPAQNVENLCFADGCQLEGEFDLLFRSLFKNPDDYMAVVTALARRKSGMTNAEIRKFKGLPTGTALTRVLSNLVLCGFVDESPDFSKRSYGKRYRLTDPFTSFHVKFLANRSFDSWSAHMGTPGYMSWRGNAFEAACIAHIGQIKEALGISGVETRASSWISGSSDPGAQVDLVIDRADGIVDLCEMKFTNDEFAIDKRYHEVLENKRGAFVRETGTRKAVHIVLVTLNGLKRNEYYHTVQSVITGDQLFRQ